MTPTRPSRRSRCSRILGAALCVVGASGVHSLAQEEPLTPVDQTISDISPIGTSLQLLQQDFGAPQGFDRVYTSPSFPGKFVRVEGALWVVFPQSRYVQTDNGLQAVLPENAVFYIGGPPESAHERAAEAPPSKNYLNGMITTRVRPVLASERRAQTVSPEVADHPRVRETVWSSDFYRRARLAELLARARGG